MNWLGFLQAQGARADMQDFGDLPGELESARASTVVAPLTDLGVIAVAGDDAVIFLHNLLTNDIKGLGIDAACHAGLCNAKGRLLATMMVWPAEQGLRLALAADLVATVQKKLTMYVLRAKVQLADASEQELLLGLSGPKAREALASLGVALTGEAKLGRFPGGISIALGGDRFLLALSPEFAERSWLKLTTLARPVGIGAWHWLDIVAGIPRISAATQEEFVPQMVNYDLLGGVSFTKGCYPGQEIVARSQYLGKIKRHMYRLRLEGARGELRLGAALFSALTEDQPCGTIVQAAASPQGGTEALAVLPASCFEAGDIHLDSRQGPALRFLPLPYDNAHQP